MKLDSGKPNQNDILTFAIILCIKISKISSNQKKNIVDY